MKFYTAAQTLGNNIFVRGWDDAKGGYFKEKVDFKPTLFLPSKSPTEFRTLDGKFVSPIQPGTIKDCRQFIDNYSSVDGMEVYGMERFLYQYLSKEFKGDIEYDPDKIKMWSLDIETASENGFPKPEEAAEEVLLITMKNFRSKKMITFSSRPYNGSGDTEYILCQNEKDMLITFVEWWTSVEPDIITGWNVDLFDMTYLCNRISRVLGEKTMKRLSPWNYVVCNQIDKFNRKFEQYSIGGVTILDYMDVYKKFTFTNRESYRLDVIAEIELGEKKLDHSEYDTFKEFYTHDWDKFVDYNLHDVNLVDRMEEKMQLISLIMLMAYDAHVNFVDTFAQVRLWDVIIYNYLRERNYVLPLISKGSKSEQYAGAYVKEPVPGSYEWVCSFDLNSLYPSLIRLLNISPETLQDIKHPNTDVEKMILKEADLSYEEDFCVAANGSMYSKTEQGFMPALVTKIYDERVQYKKNMLRCKQQLVDIKEEMKKRGLS